MAEQGMPLEMPEPRRKRRSGLLWAVSLLLLALVAGGGVWLWMYLGVVTADNAVVDGRIYTISPAVSSNVAEVLAAQGQSVGQGQPLVRLDGLLVQRSMAEAGVSGPSVPSAPTPVEAAERLAQAQAMEESTVRRVAALRQGEEHARQELERQVTAHVRAQLDMRGLEARGASRNQIARAQQKEAQAREIMERSRATMEENSRVRAAVEGELTRVREDIARARRAGNAATPGNLPPDSMTAGNPAVLVAPVAGRIVQQAAVAGATVQPGQPLVSMVSENPKDLWVLAYFSEKAAEDLQAGQSCAIRPDAASAASVPGVVETVFPAEKAPERAGNAVVGTMRVPVRIRITDYDPSSMPAVGWGMNTSVSVRTRSVPWLDRLTGGALPGI